MATPAPVHRFVLRTLLALVVALPALASAQASGGWTLHVAEIPGACAAPEDLRERVIERMGRDPFAEGSTPGVRSLEIRVEPEGDVRSITVELLDAEGVELGRRALEVRTDACDVLEDALVLLIAATIAEVEAPSTPAGSGPDETLPVVEPPQASPGGSPSPPRSEARTEGIEEEPAEPVRERQRLALWIGGTGAIAEFPEPAGGPSVGMELELAPVWPITVDAAWRGQPDLSAPGGRVTLWQLAVALGTCPRAVQIDGLLEFAVCGALQGAFVKAEGHQYPVDRSADLFQFDLRLSARLVLAILEPFVLALDVGAWVPLLRDRFFVEPVIGMPVVVHEPSWVVGFGTLSLGARFEL